MIQTVLQTVWFALKGPTVRLTIWRNSAVIIFSDPAACYRSPALILLENCQPNGAVSVCRLYHSPHTISLSFWLKPSIKEPTSLPWKDAKWRADVVMRSTTLFHPWANRRGNAVVKVLKSNKGRTKWRLYLNTPPSLSTSVLCWERNKRGKLELQSHWITGSPCWHTS